MHTLKSSNNTTKEEKTYNYELTSKSVKVGKNNTNVKVVTFYTTGDDDLRYVEDVAEELCELHKLPHSTTVFYEYDNVNKVWYHVQLHWDNKRFRGTCFIELDYNPLTEYPKKHKKVSKVTSSNEKADEARETVFNVYQTLLKAN